ncbi:hypothetical protein SAMN05216357_112133 [Porphyromonadaceae bacterium KH3CP3RA]|nr:hypothetical protein SAMN05216357_112133 [Porphyromonadaceae bacterium KH3CP3RA]
MKKILFLLLAVALFVNCDPNDTPDNDKGKLDPNAMITIRPADGVQLKATVPGLTATEIVEQTVNIKFQSQWWSNVYSEEPKELSRGFAEAQRDLTIPALKMWGTDIIAQDGSFMKEFIYGTDVYLTDNNNDTIGYVPQSVINSARTLIEAAYDDENYTEVYRLFDEAFTFLPIE